MLIEQATTLPVEQIVREQTQRDCVWTQTRNQFLLTKIWSGEEEEEEEKGGSHLCKGCHVASPYLAGGCHVDRLPAATCHIAKGVGGEEDKIEPRRVLGG